MCRLIECTTGHNNLNYLQSKIYPEDTSETFDHLLNECPCFQKARFDILHNQPIINTFKWDSAFSHIWIADHLIDRYGPGMGGTPLPSTTGTGT